MNEQDSEGSEPRLLGQIVAKLKNEPFLFVIGIAVLLAGFVIRGSDVGTETIRLVVVTVAILAAVAILGYYIVFARRDDSSGSSTATDADTSDGSIRGSVRAEKLSGDASLTGVRIGGNVSDQLDVTGSVDIGEASGGDATGVDLGRQAFDDDAGDTTRQ